MKIDKRRPGHWLLLCGFLAMGIFGLVLRVLTPRGARTQVLFYGHQLNGNLRPIHNRLAQESTASAEPVFLSMDRALCAQLRRQGVRAVWACGPRAAWCLAHANALISSHGLHSLGLLLSAYRRLGVRFFDVWHGIPFKGFDADDFRLQHRYDEIWVASPLLKNLYVERFGFDPGKVVATGYARTDRLVRQDEDIHAIKRDLGLDGLDVGPIVLIAPTWKQDAEHRSIYPFDTDEDSFLGALSYLATRQQCTIVLRTHLNSSRVDTARHPRIVQRAAAEYPDAEAILLVSDVLVCDWSSIAFDWLLLDRPTIFLDVDPPFAKGLSLDASYRYGAIVKDMATLLTRLAQYLTDESAYQGAYGQRQGEIRERVYGTCADGECTSRCVTRLRADPILNAAG